MALVRAADVRAGRRDLPHRRVHRPAPRRARRAALARRRLRAARTIRVTASYTERPLTTPKSRQGALGADGARSSPRRSRGSASASELDRRRRPRLPRDRRRLPRRLGAVPALQGRARSAPGCGDLRFHDLRHTFGTHGDRQPARSILPAPGVDGPRGHRRRR